MWMATVARIASVKSAERLSEIPREIEKFLSDLTGAAGAFVGIDVNVKPLPESLDTAVKKKGTPAPSIPSAPSRKAPRATL